MRKSCDYNSESGKFLEFTYTNLNKFKFNFSNLNISYSVMYDKLPIQYSLKTTDWNHDSIYQYLIILNDILYYHFKNYYKYDIVYKKLTTNT